ETTEFIRRKKKCSTKQKRSSQTHLRLRRQQFHLFPHNRVQCQYRRRQCSVAERKAGRQFLVGAKRGSRKSRARCPNPSRQRRAMLRHRHGFVSVKCIGLLSMSQTSLQETALRSNTRAGVGAHSISFYRAGSNAD